MEREFLSEENRYKERRFWSNLIMITAICFLLIRMFNLPSGLNMSVLTTVIIVVMFRYVNSYLLQFQALKPIPEAAPKFKLKKRDWTERYEVSISSSFSEENDKRFWEIISSDYPDKK